MAKGTCKAGFSEEGYTAWVSHNIPKGGKLLKGRTTGVQAGGAVSPGMASQAGSVWGARALPAQCVGILAM